VDSVFRSGFPVGCNMMDETGVRCSLHARSVTTTATGVVTQVLTCRGIAASALSFREVQGHS
jgi:hypothetical protein